MVIDRKFFAASLLFILLIVGFFYFLNTDVTGRTFYVVREDRNMKESGDPPVIRPGGGSDDLPNPLSGVRCKNYDRRPLAVMIAEDSEARPLSGLSSADVVIEMPVVTGSITRMMAIFVCSDSEEIGSVRSARHDFIPLALGYDAIYAHWGGSKMALDELKRGIIDNLDALPNLFNVFYRKNGIPMPHDGFTSVKRMMNASGNLGYRLTSNFEGYEFIELDTALSYDGVSNQMAGQVLEIGYRRPYNIRYEYYPNLNSYLRWRGGVKEIDALTGEQVSAKNIVVMRAASRQIGGGYNDIDILGRGRASVYRNGEKISGEWVKEKAIDVLRFYDSLGEEVQFVPGSIWIEVVEPTTEVVYK